MRLGTRRKNGSQQTAGPPADGPASVVGPELTVHGALSSSGEIHVHGNVWGDISAPKVTLWPDGYVEGSILAHEAHIHGHLKGRAVAWMAVIGADAMIEGQVFHHKIDMPKGLHIDARFPWRPVNYFDQFDPQRQQTE